MKRLFLTGILSVALVFGLFFTDGCASKSKTVAADASISFDPTVLQNVVRVTDSGLAKDGCSVSPDGKMLLYTEGTAKTVSGLSEYRIMLLRDVNLPAKTPLITDPSFCPSWYEDNTRFVYVSSESGTTRLIRSSISGGAKTYITRNSIGDSDTRPDVKNGVILCDTLINGKRTLISLKDDGSEITHLGAGSFPKWHPSESKFVFVRDGKICEMDEKYQVTELYSEQGVECFNPSYSPNGAYILFSKKASTFSTVTTATTASVDTTGMTKKEARKARREARKAARKGATVTSSKTTESQRIHVHLIKSNGTAPTQLTSGNVDCTVPRWGSNNEIYFIANVQNQEEVWRAKLASFP
jgi:Tol biopolymer transport system component